MSGGGPLWYERFEPVAPIGCGGIATVWSARDLGRGGAPVALKVLHAHLRADPIVCERFRREVEISGSLDHPCIVRAHDLFEGAEGLAFSMERLEGRTLKEAIQASGPLPVDETRRVARRCLEGLSAAHAAGVVHRDLKPSNIFLCSTGEVKLLDFGFARVAVAAGLTRSRVLCTPEYAAPELILGLPVDGRADLYALGVVLFEALTGRLPYRGTSPFDLLKRHVEEPPPSPRGIRPEIPMELEHVVLRLLQKAPEARLPTSEAVLAVLDEPRRLEHPRPNPGCCPLCGEPRDPTWALCPACGGSERAASGEWMVVLTRAPRTDAAQRLLEVVRSVDAAPCTPLARARPSVASGLPRVVLKGVGEPLAHRVRDRCLDVGLQVELRRFAENNSDLLHRSATPGLVFLAGFLLPWIAAGAAIVYFKVRSAADLPLPIAVFALGPVLARLLLRCSHLLLPPLATLPTAGDAVPIPSPLVERYRAALRNVKSPSLRGTLTRLFERALVVCSYSRGGSGVLQDILEGPRSAALALALRGIGLAEAAQEALDRLGLADEPRLWAELEALRAQAGRSPRGSVSESLIEQKERTLRQVSELERAQVAAAHQLLRVASTLELVAVQVLSAGVPEVGGLSEELERVAHESTWALEAARSFASTAHP